MSDIFGVASIDVVQEGSTVATVSVTSGLVDVVIPTIDAVEVIAPQAIDVIEVVSTGPQGENNLYVGPTAPSNPFEGLVWIDTS